MKARRCPSCKGPAAARAVNPWHPFCSERCKMADLGGWFAGRYSIPAEDDPEAPPPEQGPQSRQ